MSKPEPRVMVGLRVAELVALREALLKPGVRSGMGIVKGTRRGSTQTPLQLALNAIDEAWMGEVVRVAKEGDSCEEERPGKAQGDSVDGTRGRGAVHAARQAAARAL